MTAIELKEKARALLDLERGNKSYEIALYASDEKSPITDDGSCRGSGGPKEDHSGSYELVTLLDDKLLARTSLRKDFRFREGSAYEGASVVNLEKPNESLVMITQYGGCMNNHFHLYRMNRGGNFQVVNFIVKKARTDSMYANNLEVVGDKVVVYFYSPSDRPADPEGSRREFYRFDGRNLILSKTELGLGEENE